MSDNKVLKFELDPKSLKVKDLLNKDFLEIEVKAISSIYPNRNLSSFDVEGMRRAVNTVYNKPVLGAFNLESNDYEAHNDGGLCYDGEYDQFYYDYTEAGSEIPLGVIRSTDKVEVYQDKKDGLWWLKFSCVLWTKYSYRQVKKLLKSKTGHKKVSVEVEVTDWEIDDNGIEIIKDFVFDGVTILGDAVTTGIQDANLTILDMVENQKFQKKQKCLRYAYDALKEKEAPEVKEVMEVETVQVDTNTADSAEDAEILNMSSEAVANEDTDEITMIQEEGGEQKVLTYETKRSLLEGYICNHIHDNDEAECCCYCWICDLDDNFVYFRHNDVTYRAPYAFIENAEGETEVNVDLSVKEQVVQTWVKFSVEEEVKEETFEEVEEAPAKEETEACETEACETEACVTETEETKEETEEKVCEDEDGENKDENPDDSDEDDKPEDKEDDFSANEENESKAEDFVAPIDLNSEPSDVEPSQTMEEIIEESTESIAAPEVQTEVEDLGDANNGVDSVLNNVEQEVSADEVIVTSEVSEGPAGEEAVVVTEAPMKTNVEQPMDVKKEGLFSNTIELDGEKYDIEALAEKYTALKNEYEAIVQEMNNAKAQKLVEFTKDFINADELVDAETKIEYIAQISEKCLSFEFTSEEDVKKFAKSLLAMYYYENRSHTNSKNGSDFSINLGPTGVHKTEKPVNELQASMNKLKKLS